MPGNPFRRLLTDVSRQAVRALVDGAGRAGVPTSRPARRGRQDARPSPTAGRSGYPGDFSGTVVPRYAPDLDGAPDPGEVVWTWVPYEEDHTRGKDRPVLLVGRDGPWLLGLMLTSRDHDARPDRRGGLWEDVGFGPWDPRGRPSEVRVDRVVRVDPAAVRREGAVVPRPLFDAVVRAMPAARRP